MSIAKKKIIEGHGGDIRINSKAGIGAEVAVRLPYRLGEKSGWLK